MISWILVFINGILAGLSGCVFLIFPILIKYISKKESTYKGIVLFSLGLFLAQFILFFLFNLLSNTLSAKIKFFQSILMILAGSFLVLWFYYSQILKKELFMKAINFKSKNIFLMGLLFGFSLTSCSLGFQVSAIVLSVGLNLIYVLLNSLLFSFGMILPMFVIATFMKSLDALTKTYQRYEQSLATISNFLILILGYYFIYLGASALHIKSFVQTNYFYFIILIYAYVLIFSFIKTLQLKSTKRKVLSFIILISLIVLFILHCFSKKSCLVCYISDFDCMIKISIFLIILFAEFFILKKR